MASVPLCSCGNEPSHLHAVWFIHHTEVTCRAVEEHSCSGTSEAVVTLWSSCCYVHITKAIYEMKELLVKPV